MREARRIYDIKHLDSVSTDSDHLDQDSNKYTSYIGAIYIRWQAHAFKIFSYNAQTLVVVTEAFQFHDINNFLSLKNVL